MRNDAVRPAIKDVDMSYNDGTSGREYRCYVRRFAVCTFLSEHPTAVARTSKRTTATMPPVIRAPHPNLPLTKACDKPTPYLAEEKPYKMGTSQPQAVSSAAGSRHAAITIDAGYGPHTKTVDPRPPHFSTFAHMPEIVSCDSSYCLCSC